MAEVTIKLKINLAEGLHLNDDAPNSWELSSEDEALNGCLKGCGKSLKGDLTKELTQTLTNLPLTDVTGELSVKLDLYVCEDSGVCRMDNKVLKENLNRSDKEITFTLELS